MKEGRKQKEKTFFGGKYRLGVYLEKDLETEAVTYEIRGAFDQTFQEKITPGDLDILDFKDISAEYFENLKSAVRAGGGKPLTSLGVQNRPYHGKQDCHRKDHRNEPQVEQ